MKKDSILKYILKNNIMSFALVGLCQLLTMGISFALSLMSMHIIDHVIPSNSYKKLIGILLAYLFFCLLEAVISFVNGCFASIFQLKTDIKIRPMLVDKILKKSGGYFNSLNGGELFEVVMGDISAVTNFIISKVFFVITTTFNLVGTLIFLAIFNWKLVILILFFQPLSFVIRRLYAKKALKYSRLQRENLSEFVGSVQDIFMNPSELIMSGLKNKFVSRMNEKMYENYNITKKRIHVGVLFSSIAGLFSQLTFCVVLGYSGYCIMTGLMTVGVLVTFVSHSQRLMGLFESIWTFSIDISQVAPMYERVNMYYTDSFPEKNSVVAYKDVPDIEFSNVSFSYEEDSKEIYNDFSYKFMYGQNYGIIGKTGEGKSTLIKLIYDLWKPSSGNISIGGTDCSELSTETISQFVNYVSASSIVVHDTVFKNICMGNDKITKDEAMEVLKKVCLYDEVMEMEDGIDTLLGDKGSTLSSGQRQRLMLARALVNDKPILILDEPTSAIDEGTQKKVMNQIYDSYKDKTLIIITHDVSVLNQCNEVLRLENGKLNKYHLNENVR